MKKLAIVGSGPDTRDLAPWDDIDFDIWVFNEAGNHPWCKRFDAVFQMHPPEIYTGHNTKDPQHWEWLQRPRGKPIYMQEIDPRIPDSVRYPLEDAKALAGVQMFPTTFAYMAALAVLQGYERVNFYGIELSASEYKYQANGYLFWFGFLRGRLGAENVDSAILHLGNNILEVPLYGYQANFAFGMEYFSERARILDAEWTAADRSAYNIHKAIERAIEKNEYEKARQFVNEFMIAMTNCGEMAGALAEAERYQSFGDRFADRGGFECAAAKAQSDGEIQKTLTYTIMGKIEYVWNVWRQTGNPAAIVQMKQFIDIMGRAAEETGAHLGKFRENVRYITRYDDAVLAGGKALIEVVA